MYQFHIDPTFSGIFTVRLRFTMLDRPAVTFIEAARGEAAFQVIETDVDSDDAEDGELSSSSQCLLAC